MNTPIPASPRHRLDLFLAFLQIGLSGFGGVLPWAHRVLVEQRQWLSDKDFTELLSLGQSIPGPNICNMSVVIGARFFGPGGALLAISGLLLAPFVVVILLGLAYRQWGQIAEIPRMLQGMMMVSAGLILGTSLKLAIKLRRKIWIAICTLATFTLAAIFSIGLLQTLFIMAPISLFAAWHQLALDIRHNKKRS